jgi:hypothetical protein
MFCACKLFSLLDLHRSTNVANSLDTSDFLFVIFHLRNGLHSACMKSSVLTCTPEWKGNIVPVLNYAPRHGLISACFHNILTRLRWAVSFAPLSINVQEMVNLKTGELKQFTQNSPSRVAKRCSAYQEILPRFMKCRRLLPASHWSLVASWLRRCHSGSMAGSLSYWRHH